MRTVDSFWSQGEGMNTGYMIGTGILVICLAVSSACKTIPTISAPSTTPVPSPSAAQKKSAQQSQAPKQSGSHAQTGAQQQAQTGLSTPSLPGREAAPTGQSTVSKSPQVSNAEPATQTGQQQAVVEPGEQTGGGTSGRFEENAATDEERVVDLDRKLDEQLAGFDGILLGERAAIKDTAGAGGGGGDFTASQPAETEIASAPLPDGGAGGGNSDSGGGGGLPDISAAKRQGSYEPVAATQPVPADIPSGDNDDVVARQLREAAVLEKDPVLRHKLWNEYRKYKGLDTK